MSSSNSGMWFQDTNISNYRIGDSHKWMPLGGVVHDKEDDDPDPAVIVNKPPVHLKEWDITDDKTAAHTNPDYDPSEPVIIVVFRDCLVNHFERCYNGYKPIKLQYLAEQNLKYYAFPKSRLKLIRAPTLAELPLEELQPSPYHSKRLSLDEQRGLIERMEEEGEFFGIVIARLLPNGSLTVLNGHSRIWAASIVGIDTARVLIQPASELEAARIFAKYHLEDPEIDKDAYTGEIRKLCYDRMREQLTCLEDVVKYLEHDTKHYIDLVD